MKTIAKMIAKHEYAERLLYRFNRRYGLQGLVLAKRFREIRALRADALKQASEDNNPNSVVEDAEEVADEAPTVDSTLLMTVPEVVKQVKSIEDVFFLTRLLAEEKAGGARKGVLSAIEKRLSSLSA